MSKKATIAASTFEVGQTATVCNSRTGGEPVAGVIEAIAKGWYVLTVKGIGKVSARIGSLSAIAKAPATTSIAGQLAAATAKPEKASKAKPAKHEEPDACPECGAEGLEYLGGGLGCECPECGWTGEPEEAGEETAAHRMAAALRAARVRYTKGKRPDGSATAHCNDAIAKELRDLEPLETADLADKVLQAAPGTHAAKYGHLNNGQIRMNSGNRIRAYWKGIHEEANEAEIERVSKLLNLETDDSDEIDGEYSDDLDENGNAIPLDD